ncbi:MAG: RNA polymerase sigma factor RpoE [Ruminobacter sp.]|uniref:RNA polymerase sigma factor RpoE n=1 Tax=Ruminobacter sp. TaxID=2774296 RepID=UPI001B2F0400|nr:RNA polymerase sigma factor RpoE [Ruminobacter sp.]MBO6009737.1 RNA polymerase sigma factor RpoE [Ruminobacter sp.]MBP3748219.1 RNA polymerase sigma factor RpoE [Ruminobacter sp.]
MSDLETDLQLVRLVQQGKKQAFDMLVKKYQYKVIGIAQRYVSNPDDAQDIAQEAFIKTYRALADFRGDSAFYTWLYRITVNTAMNFVTSNANKIKSVDVNTPEIESYDGSEKLHDIANPENIMEGEDARKLIKKALGSLSEDLRQAICLREIEEMSYEDIAVVMNCPVGTVRSRIFRAREIIDKYLSEKAEVNG